jgi:hypothetical protein
MHLRCLTFVAVGLLTGQALAQDAPALTSDKDKLSYALGMDLGNQLRRLSVDLDPAVFGQALADALSGGKTQMTLEEVRLQIGALQAEMRRRQVEARSKAAEGRVEPGVASPAQESATGEGSAAPEQPQ